MLNTFIVGFLTSAGLLVAIGAQNTFVLRQGIKQEYILTVSTVCFLCDAILMSFGVFGIGKLISENSIFLFLLTVLGVVFLSWYGFNALRAAYTGNSMLIVKDKDDLLKMTFAKITVTTLAMSLLNPNVWLDTVAIIGSISTTVEDNYKLFYLFGALSASFIWFYSIGFLGKWLTRYFATPITWKIIDLLIGIYMLYMAYKLALNNLTL